MFIIAHTHFDTSTNHLVDLGDGVIVNPVDFDNWLLSGYSAVVGTHNRHRFAGGEPVFLVLPILLHREDSAV